MLLAIARRMLPRPQLARPLSWAAAAAATAAAVAAARASEAEAALPIQVEKVTLKDGRALAFRSMGDPDGIPIIALHGMSSSHLTWVPKVPLASIAPGERLIAIDRPG